MAQVDNARPVSDHHPMNKSRLSMASAILLHGVKGVRPVFTTAKRNLWVPKLFAGNPSKHLNA